MSSLWALMLMQKNGGKYLAGKYIFESLFVGNKLEEIADPNHFELFDYKVSDKPIYVDFKNWHESTDFNNKEMLAKIERKASSIPDCKCVMIVNLIADDKYMVRSVKLNNGVDVVIVPSLLSKNNGVLSTNRTSYKEIGGKINEYNNQNQQVEL